MNKDSEQIRLDLTTTASEMEQYIVNSKTKDLIYLRRVDKKSSSDLIVNKKFIRKLLKECNNPQNITCEQLVSIEYASENDAKPMSVNGILKYKTND